MTLRTDPPRTAAPRIEDVATFQQAAPRPVDLYQADAALQAELKRRVPAGLRERVEQAWRHMGQLTATELWSLQRQAEAEPPRLVQYDAWGKRIDRIEVSPAWDRLKAISAQEGLVAQAYDPTLGPTARVLQAGLIHLFSASSAIFSCPLAMTDAAASVLRQHLDDDGGDDQAARLLDGLLSRDPATFITSGQWMTERPGGSDVGLSETIARPAPGGDPAYTLHGLKWFTSATTSEMALTLARIQDGDTPPPAGSRGLTMFLVEVQREDDGGLQGLRIQRLKDKLGTKALPTAELGLDGVRATRLGPPGRGVAEISTMLNVTRYWNACSSSSAMAQAAAWARDYATTRVAFGRPIAEHPAHRRTLLELEADAAGALALCMELASLMGAVETGMATPDQQALLRGLLPVAKLTTGKQAVAVTSEALEAFGGAGYVEDTHLPRMLRDAQVLPIWEGTTNVLALDLLRAEARDGALSALLGGLDARIGALPGDLAPTARATLETLSGRLRALVAQLAADGDRARMEWEARRIALTSGLCWQALLLAETAAALDDAALDDAAAAARFSTFVSARLAGPLG